VYDEVMDIQKTMEFILEQQSAHTVAIVGGIMTHREYVKGTRKTWALL